MAVSRSLVFVFLLFYVSIFIYLFLFFFIPDVQRAIIQGRNDLTNITEGSNYIWALIISFVICLLGSASIGFPVPFPFVLFSLSNSILRRYAGELTAMFWAELFGIAIVGGLGSILGEYTSYMVGKGAREIAEKVESEVVNNVKGFGRLVLNNPTRTSLYIFLAAATPVPDDALMLSLGMLGKEMGSEKYPFRKIILPGWLGKNITTISYCLLPLLIEFGFFLSGTQSNDVSSIISEAIMLLVTLTIMFFILAFNWNRYLENRIKKRTSASEDKSNS
ncbi:MAG: hypothetical protein GF383_14165 [Candidatus Lokiarchaeota archaeon]|nr:hypothetical protein [Candidatus Lokiarchaeota archaeon]MBD3342502.1 hypothetical protein [Candidatus Lokiarchaeota archaeon]